MLEEDTEAKQDYADGREGPQNRVCGYFTPLRYTTSSMTLSRIVPDIW